MPVKYCHGCNIHDDSIAIYKTLLQHVCRKYHIDMVREKYILRETLYSCMNRLGEDIESDNGSDNESNDGSDNESNDGSDNENNRDGESDKDEEKKEQ